MQRWVNIGSPKADASRRSRPQDLKFNPNFENMKAQNVKSVGKKAGNAAALSIKSYTTVCISKGLSALKYLKPLAVYISLLA